ncbi:MAG TPA: hypothetical protein VFA09_26885 [Ktedonobacteraceae bacterium]|nr:hypothetical protein [Ktedonobacteraceae bacterium]
MIDPLTRLWLPESFWEHQVHMRRSGVLVYLGWRDVTGNAMPYERLVELLSSLRTESILIAISMISIITTNTPSRVEVIRQQHADLAQRLSVPWLARRIELLIRSGRGDAIVHHEQLLLAARLAFLHGQPGPSEGTPLELIGELLLGINDLFNYGQQPTTPQELLITLASRRQAIALSGQPRYQLARYFDMFVTRSRKKAQATCDLDAAFLRQAHISLEEYMAFALLYQGPFFGAASVHDLQQNDFLHRVRLFETQVRDPQFLTRCQQLFARNAEEFQAIWYDRGDQPVEHLSYLPFQLYPLFRLSNGSAIPIALSFLYDKMSVGAYWLLHESFRVADAKKGVPAFTKYVGELFQDYITDLLTRVYVAVQPERFFDEASILQASPRMQQAIRRGKPPRCCDGILVSGNSLVLFEMTATALPVQTLVEADPTTFPDEVRRKFQHKIEQLGHTFDGLAQHIIDLPGLKRDTIAHVYPVLVLLQPFPQHSVTWNHVLDFAKKPGQYVLGAIGTEAYVHAPQILTAEELEMLEPLLSGGSFSLPALLAQKMEHDETATMSMKDYLLRWKNLEEQPNMHVLGLFDIAVNRLRDILKSMINFVDDPERVI